jgi:hypothetical protein
MTPAGGIFQMPLWDCSKCKKVWWREEEMLEETHPPEEPTAERLMWRMDRKTDKLYTTVVSIEDQKRGLPQDEYFKFE